MTDLEQLKQDALRLAGELGFALAGVAPAADAVSAETAAAFRRWLDAGHHADMGYMGEHVEQRLDVRVNLPWAASVLCLAAGYAEPPGATPAAVARYARGRDYHRVLKGRCRTLADALRQRAPGMRTRIFVDSAPVLERSLAARAGLGWIGKNTCLIHPRWGSWLLLAEIALSEPLPPDEPMAPQCGDCRACLDACPNGALVEPYVLDARRCNGWATVECRSSLDGDALDVDGCVFGCDVCQAVCPFNRQTPEGLATLTARRPPADADLLTILHWSAEEWDAATAGTAVRRATREMLLRNACLAVGRRGRRDALPRLVELASRAEPLVAQAARWALSRLSGNADA